MTTTRTHRAETQSLPRLILGKALLKTARVMAMVLIYLATTQGLQAMGVGITDLDRAHSPSIQAPISQVSPADALAASHDCWEDQAPEGVAVPTHVVATTAQGRLIYGGQALTSKALEQALEIQDHHLTIHAFCR